MVAVLADDDVDSAEALAMLADGCVSRTVVVNDGRLAVRKALEVGQDVRLVLLDMEMPGLNGFDAGMQIRLALGAKPIIIGFSGSRYLLNAARESGFFDLCFEKPVIGNDFLVEISSLCQSRKSDADKLI